MTNVAPDSVKRYLVTGSAGFIGYHVAARLLSRGDTVIGADNFNDYYDVNLKEARHAKLVDRPGFSFHRMDLADRARVAELFAAEAPARVIHLAAQAGVRYSLEQPHAYVDSNLVAFVNILEGCRAAAVEHLVFASTSSVYGANTSLPFSVHDSADHPLSLYAATKKSNELLAHTYSHLFGLPSTGLRFFTVYGPWSRPDMAPIRFAKAILEGQPIDVYNHGNMRRDFTFIDDIAQGVVLATDHVAAPNPEWDGANPDPATSYAPYRIYNIGNGNPVELMRFIEAMEEALGREAVKNFLPLQPGDVLETSADVSDLKEAVGFRPDTPVQDGVRRFVDWYLDYYGA
ncbi:MAG: NAD-dependent epimerase [Gemmatimonadota bacterium]